METTGRDACTRGAVETTQRQLSVIKRNSYVCFYRCHSARSDAPQYKGMLDIPPELLLIISAYMDHHDLRALGLTSRDLCRLLLPEYLRGRGLTLKDTFTGGKCVELYSFSGCAALGLWSIVPMFHPPEEIYCSIPYDAQEARRAIRFITHFLLDPSKTSHLRNFHLSLSSSNLLPIKSELIKIQDLFCVLPLTRLCISGFDSATYIPPSIPLRGGTSCGSRTLTSLSISSDHAFAPGFVKTTLGILKHSPIKSLEIFMVSLSPSQWSALLGQLDMPFLEAIQVEGDIPRPSLLRFLMKHRGLRTVRIRGSVPSDRIQPSRSQIHHFLPNLRTLHAPLAVCCDIIMRASSPSSLWELHVELSRLHPPDPLFHQLLEALRHFQNLDRLGLLLVPSPLDDIPHESPGDWDGHPACELKQVRTLSFRNRGLLSPGDIVSSYTFPRLLALLA